MRVIKFQFVIENKGQILITDSFELDLIIKQATTEEEIFESLEPPCDSSGCNNESQNFCDCHTIFEEGKIIAKRQYTGLKDKNGIEIYEGDIFREELEHDEGDIRNYSAVTWIKQRSAFYLVPVAHLPILRDNDVSKEDGFDWLFQHANLYDFSIDIGLPLVGNIYQNPELIK